MNTSRASVAWSSPAVGRRLDVAEVVARAAQASRPDWFARSSSSSSRRLAGLAEQDRQGEDVEVADAVVVRQAGLRAHAQAARDRLAVPDRAERRAAAEVARDEPEVVAAEQLGHPAGDVAMARAVEAPAPDAVLGRPVVGHGVPLRWPRGSSGGSPVSKAATSGMSGNRVAEHPHRLDVRRVVGGGDRRRRPPSPRAPARRRAGRRSRPGRGPP